MNGTKRNRGCIEETSAKYLIVVFNMIIWLLGCGLVALGYQMWRGKDWPTDYLKPIHIGAGGGEWMFVIAVIYILCGGIVVLLGILGCVGALKLSRFILGIYVSILLLVIAAEILAVTTALFFRSKVENESFRINLKKSIRDDYLRKYVSKARYSRNGTLVTQKRSHRNKMALLWYHIQYKFRCCGVDSFMDYRYSKYYNQTGPLNPHKRKNTNGQRETCVPPVCCQRKKPQEMVPRDDPSRSKFFIKLSSDPLFNEEFVYRDAEKCYNQTCAKDSVSSLDQFYVQTKGCLPEIKSWFKTHIWLFAGAGLVVILFQLVTLIIAFYICFNIGHSIHKSHHSSTDPPAGHMRRSA